MSHPNQPRFVYIEFLRGIAALLVLLGHAQMFFEGKLGVPLGKMNGALGVDIFFVISGFLMVHVSREYVPGLAASGHFAANRIARIVPFYWVMTALYALAYLAVGRTEELSVLNFVKSLLFIPYGTPNNDGELTPIVGVGWTLNYEMMFYALFAALIVPMGRRAAWGVIAVIGVLVSIELVIHASGRTEGLPLILLIKNPLALEFVFGMLIGLSAGAARVRLHSWTLVLMASLGAGVLLSNAFLPLNIHGSRALINGLPAAILVYALVALEYNHPLQSRTVMAQRFKRFALYLGSLSYSLYLTHFLGLMVLVVVLQRIWSRVDSSLALVYASLAISMILLFVAAHLAQRWIEAPLSRKARKLLSRPKPAVFSERLSGQSFEGR